MQIDAVQACRRPLLQSDTELGFSARMPSSLVWARRVFAMKHARPANEEESSGGGAGWDRELVLGEEEQRAQRPHRGWVVGLSGGGHGMLARVRELAIPGTRVFWMQM